MVDRNAHENRSRRKARDHGDARGPRLLSEGSSQGGSQGARPHGPRLPRTPRAAVPTAALALGLLLLAAFTLLQRAPAPATAQTQPDLALTGARSASGPGGLVTFTLGLKNNGAADSAVSLAAPDSSWIAHLPAPFSLAAGSSRSLVVGYEMPLAVRDGDVQELPLVLLADGAEVASLRLAAWAGGRIRLGKQTGCRFDLDLDGAVTLDDVDRVEGALGRLSAQPGYDANLDLDHSGAIDRRDVETVVDQLRPACAPLLAAVDTAALQAAITLPGLRRHLERLQAIADANGGNRAARTPGYAASVDYVAGVLEGAGYSVTRQAFDIPTFVEKAPPGLARLAPDPLTFAADQIATLTSSGSGVITATLAAVDLVLPPGMDANSSTSGCQDEDFADFPKGAVALIQRGSCNFGDKVNRAVAAGAAAVILFNEGQSGRTDVVRGSAGAARQIPLLGASYAVGENLAASLAGGAAVTVRLEAWGAVEPRRSWNVLADTAAGREDRVVVLGGHLDSVPAGAGINDNGSGSAAILETAVQVAALGIRPANKLRFAFWGGEELGLLGSRHYVQSLDEAARSDILANLNVDMIGSPNPFRGIYDGDGSFGDKATAGPIGSGEIEQVFAGFFDARRLPHDPTAFDGRSDYGPFIAAGIPAGGLFTGAEDEKDEAMAARYGGKAGEAFDPCYHRACDGIANIDWAMFDEMADALAHTTLSLAMDRSLPVVSGRIGRLGLADPRPVFRGLALPWLGLGRP